MSATIIVQQQPLSITPTNGEHIWNFESPDYTLPNFKFIIDVFFRPSVITDYSGTTPMARLKVRPNTQGRAIVELNEIVRTFLKTNPRFSGSTYPYLNYVAEENSIITLSDFQNTRTYNAYNLWPGGGDSQSVPVLWHMEQYRVMVGCEYDQSGTTVTEINYEAEWQPGSISIFPGVDNKLIPSPFLSAAQTGTFTNANWYQFSTLSWLYYDLFRYYYTTGNDEDCTPREFLNAGGREYKIISQSDVVSTRVRRRMHHPDCPIILSFLDGQNDYFTNTTENLVVRSALSYSSDYSYSASCANDSNINENYEIWKMGVFYLPYNVTSQGTNIIPTNSKKLAFYLSSSGDLDWANRQSEILEFYMQEPDCINEPIHLLFLNGRGQWDTYTFGKKSTKTYEIERKTYRKEASLNRQWYTRGSYERGINVYETEADYSIECMSWYMDENDTEIVEEIFLSPEVFIIDGTSIDPKLCIDELICQSCLGEIRLYQSLIPVVVQEKSLQQYQKQYQKLFQYTLTLKYANIKKFRTAG
jgi:hypothetical protein